MDNRTRINKAARSMGGALNLGTFAGIPVKVHWTFGLLLLFVVYTAFSNGLKTSQSIGFILYILILFLCVVLHEFGHALTARKYGITTRESEKVKDIEPLQVSLLNVQSQAMLTYSQVLTERIAWLKQPA